MAALERVGFYSVAVIKELGEEGPAGSGRFARSYPVIHGLQGEPPASPLFSNDAFAGYVQQVDCLRALEGRYSAGQPPALTRYFARPV